LLVDDDAQMVRAIATIVENPTLRQTIGDHNKTTAPSVTWESVLSRADAMYAKATLLATDQPARIPAVGP
jgi:hypothetical protein